MKLPTLKTCLSALLGFCLMCSYSHAQSSPDSTYLEVQFVGSQSIRYLPVFVLQQEDSSLVRGWLSDSTGRVRLPNLPYGSFFLALEQAGGEYVIIKDFEMNAAHSRIDLGTLSTLEKSYQLDQVTIKGQKTIFKQEAEKLIVDIDGTFLSKGNAGGELLPLLPGIMMQGQKIEVNGKKALILIDGKGKNNQQQVQERLRDMRSEEIQSIEIISNPSARYDAQIGSIINIITKRGKSISSAGIRGATPFFPRPGESGLSFQVWTPSLNLNLGNDRLKSNVFLSMGTGKDLQAYGQDRFLEGELFYQSSTRKEFSKQYLNLSTDLEYDLHPNHTLGLQVGLFKNLIWDNDLEMQIDFTESSLHSLYQSEASPYDLSVSSFYHVELPGKGGGLTFFYEYGELEQVEDATYRNISTKDAVTAEEVINIQNGYSLNIHEYNAHYQRAIGEHIQGELGAKYTFFTQDQIYAYQDQNDSTDAFDFQYKENFWAPYAMLSGFWNKWSVEGGLRYENTDGLASNAQTERKISYDYFFPTLHLNHDLKKWQVGLSYAKKIQRLGAGILNPGLLYEGPVTLGTGNLNIAPEIRHEMEMRLSNRSQWSFTLAWNQTQNGFVTIPSEDPNNPLVFQSVNLRYQQNWSGNLYFQLKPWDKVRIISNTRLSYVLAKGDDFDLNLNAWNIASSIYSLISLPKDIRLEPSLNLFGPSNFGYTETDGFVNFSLSLKKPLWKRKGQVSLAISDVFGTAKVGTREFYGADQEIINPALLNGRQVQLRFSYRFNTGYQFSQKGKRAKSFQDSRTN
ncbi:MAG: outer membrane beta-barrel protein [Bacteroidota bacterium]